MEQPDFGEIVSGFAAVSFLTSSYSGSWQMLGVSHFNEALLKAVEDELMVRVSFTRFET